MRYSEGMDMPGSLIWHQREVTRKQGPIRALVSFTLLRNLQGNMGRARLLGSSLRLACSGWPGWFHIHLFYLSKLTMRVRGNPGMRGWEEVAISRHEIDQGVDFTISRAASTEVVAVSGVHPKYQKNTVTYRLSACSCHLRRSRSCRIPASHTERYPRKRPTTWRWRGQR